MKFKAGDRVRYRAVGQLGTVVCSHPYIVIWDNGNWNSYEERDLSLAEVEESAIDSEPEKVDSGDQVPKPLFKVGDKVKLSTSGKVGLVLEVDRKSPIEYPYCVGFPGAIPIWCPSDELELVPEEPKKILNFWEARAAALAGKRVKMVGTTDEYVEDDFECDDYSFDNEEIKADWEIVEEPVRRTFYVNVYHDHFGRSQQSKEEADNVNCHTVEGEGRISCLEITVDGEGKLVEAKNV